jgi:hypothetical protein
MQMRSTLSGGCACGAVRGELTGDPVFAGQGRCRDCQRATGTRHADALAYPDTRPT